MTQDEMRQQLISSTIYVVATEGIHKATTKAISTHAQINEAYIYRFFNDKDDMLEKAFSYLDGKMVSIILEYLSVTYRNDMSAQDKCKAFFCDYWNYLLDNLTECSFFIKYYYSQHYNSYPVAERKKAYSKVIEAFTPAFKRGTDVWAMLNHILDIIFTNIVKVLRDQMPANEKTAEFVYDLLYSSLEAHLAWTN